MKKIVFFSHSNQIGGAEIVLFRVISKLSQAKEYNLTLVVPKMAGKLSSMFNEIGCAIVELDYHCKLPYDSFKPSVPMVSYFLQQVKPDLAVINTCTLPHVANICTELGTKYIYHNHSLLTETILPSIPLNVVHEIERELVKKSALTIVPSEFVKSYYDTFIRVGKINVLPNPIEMINEIIEPKKIDNNIIISILSSPDRNKGLETAVKALKLLIFPNHMKVTLHWYTDGNIEYQQELLTLAEKLNVNFNIFPKTLTVSDVYKNSHFVFVCSQLESFSNVVIESGAYGCVVCATRCGGPETLIQDRVNGFLFNVGDSQMLAEIVSNVVIDPAEFESVSKNAIENAEKYSIGNIVNNYMSLIEGVLNA